ncbi:MAG: hypothetical protein ABIT01_13490 [Thermoanaerobaculia bacterium]
MRKSFATRKMAGRWDIRCKGWRAARSGVVNDNRTNDGTTYPMTAVK